MALNEVITKSIVEAILEFFRKVGLEFAEIITEVIESILYGTIPKVTEPIMAQIEIFLLYFLIVLWLSMPIYLLVGGRVKLEYKIREYDLGWMALGLILLANGQMIHKILYEISKDISLIFISDLDLITMIITLLLGGGIIIIVGAPALVLLGILLAIYAFIMFGGQFLINFVGLMLIFPMTIKHGKRAIRIIVINMFTPAILIGVMWAMSVSSMQTDSLVLKFFIVLGGLIVTIWIFYQLYFSSPEPYMNPAIKRIDPIKAEAHRKGKYAYGKASTMGSKAKNTGKRVIRKFRF